MDCNMKLKLPFGPPPVLPDTKKQIEEYLTSPEKLPIHNNKQDFKFWKRKTNLKSLYYTEISPVPTKLKVNRDPCTGELINFKEVPVDGLGYTAQNSYSFLRPPAKITEDIRGSNSNYPFWPGGFDTPQLDSIETENCSVDFENDLLTVPPGLSRGIDYLSLATDLEEKHENVLLDDTVPTYGIWCSSNKDDGKGKESEKKQAKVSDFDIESLLKELKMPVLRIKLDGMSLAKNSVSEWAEMLDPSKPVNDFQQKLNVDKTWPFELDNFQKLAILKLNDHEHILVAAHTSAGKTVVAEFAIELSFMNHSKIVYTSPIKALSNQKFRDFKKQFGNVGLITGDFQINHDATCLVMTTEILRNMLFKGSSVIRELEYVVFDEVHYINDSERGHVWEEVLIMLPDKVCIIMLSATVPNALEFADWIGRTKKRKVYVVSTLTRPVPLQHYLFTGVEGKEENMFLIRSGDGPFLMEGYRKAVNQKTPKEDSVSAGTKDADKNQKKISQIKSQLSNYPKNLTKPILSSLVNTLQKSDLLPAVVFALSRRKCDDLANILMSLKDLTTAREKHFIHQYFHKSIKNLKEEDQQLPQVMWMDQLLQQGIGVHHSGILPILKEIVEMIFQSTYIDEKTGTIRTYIKILFATETLAMGVNMPARTVVFDSVDKHDGNKWRNLLPAEYTQMAGRAGRRNIDSRGMVIITCKNQVPPVDCLKEMILGNPKKLESQFRMTYSMILNMMKLEDMCIENILSHSFKEVVSRRKLSTYSKQLKALESYGIEKPDIDNETFHKLSQFYDITNSFVEHWKQISTDVINTPTVQKYMHPGRIVLITCKNHIRKLALILQVLSKGASYKVLVLCDESKEDEKSGTEISTLWYEMTGFLRKDVFVPDNNTGHSVFTIDCSSIMEITVFNMKIDTSSKIDPNLVLKDWDQRQLPRFKNDKPSKTCSAAIQELYEKSKAIGDDTTKLTMVPISEFKINTFDLHIELECLVKQKSAILDLVDTISEIPNFESQFLEVFKIKKREEEKKNLEYLLSYKSLKTYPEYVNKVKILQELQYVDSENKNRDEKRLRTAGLNKKEINFTSWDGPFKIAKVDNQKQTKVHPGDEFRIPCSGKALGKCSKDTTKGNAACNINRNELVITELIFDNKLSDYEPAEIVALLSCLVFTARTDCQPELSKNLKQGKRVILNIWKKISLLEQRYGVEPNPEPKFQLIEVIYKWASGKPFADIMNCIDVQEGIIVRCILQLNDILRDIKFVVGTYAADTVLKEKIEEATEKIKRDIVFTPSLYTCE